MITTGKDDINIIGYTILSIFVTTFYLTLIDDEAKELLNLYQNHSVITDDS